MLTIIITLGVIICLIFNLIIENDNYRSNPHTEEFEIISYTIDNDHGEICVYTSDNRIFRVNLPDSVIIIAISDQFPYKCTAKIIDKPNSHRYPNAKNFSKIIDGEE